MSAILRFRSEYTMISYLKEHPERCNYEQENKIVKAVVEVLAYQDKTPEDVERIVSNIMDKFNRTVGLTLPFGITEKALLIALKACGSGKTSKL